jgi:L-alanine-DL-glutamate epimerase-like enolase superfamily enzyme
MPAEAHQFGLQEDVIPNSEGVITATQLPGLGYQIDWDYIEKHKTGTLT